jgi:type III pantothenate kinase
MSGIPILIAADIGNSRIKLGRFARSGPATANDLPEPADTLDAALADRSGKFDADAVAAWCIEHAGPAARFLVSSVHRGAAARFSDAVSQTAQRSGAEWILRSLSYREVAMEISVDVPELVGIDRLLAALAADRARRRDRGAIVIDLGSAMTIDYVTASGAFAGGAILPGIAMSARALAEQTDRLPLVSADRLDQPPPALGRSTIAAIESGLYWGVIGVIGEFLYQFASIAEIRPDVFLTGGGTAHVASLITSLADRVTVDGWLVRHTPNLVLRGIAIAGESLSAAGTKNRVE